MFLHFFNEFLIFDLSTLNFPKINLKNIQPVKFAYFTLLIKIFYYNNKNDFNNKIYFIIAN